MRAIDTNVLVRVIVQDDKRQTRLAMEAIGAGAWVPSVVLMEAVWVLKSYYERQRAEIENIVSVLLNHAVLVLQDAEAVRSALAAYKANKRVDFSDCFILEMARRAGNTPLCTFDKDLAKLDGVERLGRAES